jgi:hypothetical protein
MPPGDSVEILGCVTGWSWCDILWRGYRGWAAGRYLQVLYRSQPSPVYLYGGAIGIPFINFSINLYWNEHYRSWPFFNELPRFGGYGPPSYRPGPPPPPAYPLYPQPPVPYPSPGYPPVYGGEGGSAGQSGCPGGTHHVNGVCVR